MKSSQAEQILDENLQKWSESRLKQLIQNKIEENLMLDYKAAASISRDSKAKLEVTKDVSAMANSAGGILIYGIAEDQSRKYLPEKIDPVNRIDFSKEWLEQIISQIRPRIADLKIHPVQLTSDEHHVAYVIEIPQANTAHQAADCRYYRRYNFESVMMQDHEIRDVMNRRSHPRVIASARFVVYAGQNKEGHHGALAVTITNDSDVFARYVAFVIHSPLRISGRLITYEDTILDDGDDGTGYRLSYSSHNGPPLFPRGKLKQIFPFKFISGMNPEPQKQLNYFRWVAFADSMAMQTGSWKVEEILSK